MTTTTSNSKTIEDLRTRLFDAMDKVSSGAMSLEQARQVSDLAQVIVNTAKVEVDYLRVTGGGESGFIEPPAGAETAQSNGAALPNGISGIVRHRLRG